MTTRPPGGQVGYTAEQRAAMRAAVEEEGTLELIRDFVSSFNRVADRLEAYAETPKIKGRPGEP